MRATIVIGPEGIVEHVWERVEHEGHAAEVSAWLRGKPTPGRVAAKTAAKKRK